MGKKKFTDEQKREALAKAEHYIRNGWNLRSIHRQLEAEYQNEGKEMISWWSFYPLAKAMLEELKAEGKIGADGAGANLDGPDGQDGQDGRAESEEPGEAAEESGEAAEEEEARETDEVEADEAAENDYTERLAMIVRLYRFRTEEDVDAVCDRLIPELTEVRP